MSSVCASSQNSRRYGPGSLFGPGYVEPSPRIREIRPRFTPPIELRGYAKGPCATYLCLGAIPDHLDFAPRVSRPERIFDPRWWGEALPSRGHTASQIGYGSLWILWETGKKYTRLWDPLAASDKARTSFQPQLEKAAPAIPRYRPFSRLTETRQVPDCESIHLGVGAHEMAAASLECGGELRDSAGKC